MSMFHGWWAAFLPLALSGDSKSWDPATLLGGGCLALPAASLPRCLRNSLCPRLVLSSQALISLPRGKCTKTDHHIIKASTPQALGYPLQGFRNTDKMQDAFCIHRGVIFFSALQNVPDLIPGTIYIVQSERKLLAHSFFFFPFLPYGWLIHLTLQTLFLTEMWSLAL